MNIPAFLYSAILVGMGIALGGAVMWWFARRFRPPFRRSIEANYLADAVTLLRRNQYRIIRDRVQELLTLQISGKKYSESAEVDFEVEREGKRYFAIVEERRGGEQEGPLSPPTRAKILAAQTAFPNSSLLLIRLDASEIVPVRLTSNRSPIPPSKLILILALLLLGLLLYLFVFSR